MTVLSEMNAKNIGVTRSSGRKQKPVLSDVIDATYQK